MFGMAYIENVIIEYRCIWLSGNMFSLNQRLLKSQPGSSQKAPSFLHFLFCWCPKWTNKISPEVILPGGSYLLCKTELVWLPHPWGRRVMKWFCPVTELGGGRGRSFLVFLLDCVQGGIRARRGNRKAQGHFSESSHSPRLWLNGSPSEVDSSEWIPRHLMTGEWVWRTQVGGLLTAVPSPKSTKLASDHLLSQFAAHLLMGQTHAAPSTHRSDREGSWRTLSLFCQHVLNPASFHTQSPKLGTQEQTFLKWSLSLWHYGSAVEICIHQTITLTITSLRRASKAHLVVPRAGVMEGPGHALFCSAEQIKKEH